jgi:hypothetical protein
MKTRNGFVSNSSSSSFIIRGIRIKKDELAKIFNVESWEDIPYDKRKNIKIKDTQNVFDREEQTDDCVVGMDLGDLEDGGIVEIPDSGDIDFSVRGALLDAGFNIEKINTLSTFVQYISNDNY